MRTLTTALFILACCGSLFGLWSLSQTLQEQRDQAIEDREAARYQWCDLFDEGPYGPNRDGDPWEFSLSSPRERAQYYAWDCKTLMAERR